jgi:hypothetical protein
VTTIDYKQSDGFPRSAGPAERAKLAGLLQAIGNACNATILDLPTFSDEGLRRQLVRTFATVGGFVTYADMLRQGTQATESEGMAAIVELGRALSRRVEVKPA